MARRNGSAPVDRLKLATHTDLGGQISTSSYDPYAGTFASVKSVRPDPSPGAPAGAPVSAPIMLVNFLDPDDNPIEVSNPIT